MRRCETGTIAHTAREKRSESARCTACVLFVTGLKDRRHHRSAFSVRFQARWRRCCSFQFRRRNEVRLLKES